MQAAQANMVHESEAQRRHARVRIPCKLHLLNSEINTPFELLDLSASGFAVRDNHEYFPKGQNAAGALKFNFDGLEISLTVRFQVVSRDGDDLARVGCEFHDLGVRETSTLRMIITKFLSGDVTAAGDVISTLGRDNFTKARNNNGNAPLSLAGRIKAVMGTGLVLAVGVAASAYIASNVYQSFFVKKAFAAAVSIPAYNAVTPREGHISPLVKEGDRVSIGQPIATADSPLLEVMQPAAQAAGVSQAELESMVSKRIGSVIESPCDCIVVSSSISDGQYLPKGETVMKLAALDAKPEILARFQFDDLPNLKAGNTANISLSNGEGDLTGTIKSVRLPQNLTDKGQDFGSVLVAIEPSREIASEWINLPVNVTVSEIF